MKIRPFRSIRAKLVMSLGLPLLVSYVALLSVDFVVNRGAAVAQMQSAILERADNIARVIDSRLASVTQLAQTLTTMAGASTAAPANRANMLLRDALNTRWVNSATIVLAAGDAEPIAYTLHRGGFGGPRDFGIGPRESDAATRQIGLQRLRESREDPRDAVGALREAISAQRDAGPSSRDVGDRRFNRRGGFGNASVTESPTPPAWYASAAASTAGKWIAPAAGVSPHQQTWLYVEPIRADGKVVGAIGLDVSMRSLRTLRPGPPEGFATTRPTTETRQALAVNDRPIGPPPDVEPGHDGPPYENRGERFDAPAAPGPTTAIDSGPDLAATAAATARLATSETNDFAIFDGAGRLIIPAAADEANPPTQTLFETATSIGSLAMADAARKAIAGDSEVVSVSGLARRISSVSDDSDHWLAMAPIPSTGWVLVTAVGESQYINPVMMRLGQRALFLTGGLVVMLIVVLLISMRMSRRLERLDAAVARLATGDLDAPIPDPGPADEIGRLTSGVANMSRELREHVGELTAQTAVREKVEGELRIARQIQLDLLPKTFPPFPDRTDFELHAVNEPALQVAGDFYDFFFTNDGRLTVVVADVSGKGVPAALLMAVTRTLVRTLAGTDRGPAEIVRGVNAALAHDSSSHMFVTMFLCQYEPATGRIRYVNAGHPPPLRLRAGQPPTPFCDHGSPIVGLMEDLGDFEEREETLEPGDAMLIYTDGVTDAPGDTADDYLGTSGLLNALRHAGGQSPRTVCDRLAALIRTKAARLRDDTTVLALQRSIG